MIKIVTWIVIGVTTLIIIGVITYYLGTILMRAWLDTFEDYLQQKHKNHEQKEKK